MVHYPETFLPLRIIEFKRHISAILSPFLQDSGNKKCLPGTFVVNKVPNRHYCLIIRCQLIQLTKPNAYSASPGGFEPLTPRLGGECSIQLSYEDTLTYIKYIKLFFFFCQVYRQSTSPCSHSIPLNLRPTLGSPTKSSFAIVNSI